MGLNHGDLRMTIDEVVEIDRYKAKMGTDEDVVVVNFTAENKDAGQDLVDFLESGYDWILDSAVSPGTNNRGKYMVFVEIERNVDIKDNIIIKSFSHLEDVKVENNVSIGPYARLRPGSILREGSRIGNFVEVKKSKIGKNSKVNH